MKLTFFYLFKRGVYRRYVGLQKKVAARKNRLYYAKNLMERWDKFHPAEVHDYLLDILQLKPGKKSFKFIMKLYNSKDISGLEKELPL